MDFLGHRVDRFEIRPQLEKTHAMCDIQTPSDLNGLRALLGLFSYYRKLLASPPLWPPLNRMLKKDTYWR